ncbi:MAG TPA: hypothetical protein VGI39_28120 [Polyangiaceae bacterium]|jgi:uncharacterized protein (DUF697 family)
MMDAVRKSVTRTALVSGAIGVVLSPIPLADELVFVPIFGFMSAQIGKAHGLAFKDIPWKPIASTTLAALTARAALNVAVSYIPGVAAVANAISAFTVTQMLGRYVDAACADPASAHPLSVREATERLKEAFALRRKQTA